MEEPISRTERFIPILVAAAVALALGVALIATVLYVHATKDVPFGTLTRDPLSGKPVYFGLLSQAGILTWAFGASASFLGAWLLGGRAEGRFMLSAAVLTTLLCIDDAFLLHDEVLPLAGVSEKLVYAVYLALLLGFLVLFARRILKTGYPVLLLSLAFLGVSVVADTWGLPWLDPYMLEDGSKFIGIALWSAYLFQTSGSLVRARPGANA